MLHPKLIFFLFLFTLLGACNQGNSEKNGTETIKTENELAAPQPCGNPVLVDVQNTAGASVGVFEVLNDEKNIWVSFTSTPTYRLHRVFLYIGSAEALPRDGLGNYLPSEFPFRLDHDPEAKGAWEYGLPMADFPECFVVAASMQIYSRNLQHPRPVDLSFAWARGTDQEKDLHNIEYCIRSCAPLINECPNGTDPGQFRTYSQKEWAAVLAEPELAGDFASVFGEGLTIGCNAKVELTSLEAVLQVMPSEGAAASFSGSERDPQVLANALAGEACALTMALAYDEAKEDFGASPVKLGGLLVARGPFDSWQVSDLLAEANAVLGGCASNYSAGQMEEVLRAVNLNFADGKTDLGFLRCPGN